MIIHAIRDCLYVTPGDNILPKDQEYRSNTIHDRQIQNKNAVRLIEESLASSYQNVDHQCISQERDKCEQGKYKISEPGIALESHEVQRKAFKRYK